jgi:hypothetical protein
MLGLAGAVAVRLSKLPIELLMVPPHPAASNPAASRVTGRESLFAERRMLILPRGGWPTAGASVCRRQGALSRAPGRLGRPAWDPQAAWLGDSASDTIVTVRRRAWGQIWRFRRRVPLLHRRPSASITASSKRSVLVIVVFLAMWRDDEGTGTPGMRVLVRDVPSG